MNEFGDTDVDNGLLDTAGEGESGKDGESSFNICTLSATRCIAGEKLPCSGGPKIFFIHNELVCV